MSAPRPTVGQPIAMNHRGWASTEYRADSGSAFVAEFGFAGEDWNFAKDQAVDGYVYGWGQGEVSAARRRAAPDGFDVLFYVREPSGIFRAAGLYRGARYLEGDDRQAAWETLQKAGHIRTRLNQLGERIGSLDGKAAKRAQEVYEDEQPLRWKVRVEDVITFDDLPRIPPLRSTDHRHKNAYDWTDHPWGEIPTQPEPDDLTAHEGTLIEVVHRTRERSPAFRAAVLKLRQARLAAGQRLGCEACGFDFGARYGATLDHFVEAHHAVPLATFAAQGGMVREADIVLLCANCHRAAHRTRQWSLAEIQSLLQPGPP